MKPFALIACSLLAVATSATLPCGAVLPVVPQPRSWQATEGTWKAPALIRIDAGGTSAGASLAADWRAAFGAESVRADGKADVTCRLAPADGFADEGYRLVVAPQGVTITAGTERGLFWGTRTLLQLARHDRTLTCGTVDDAPNYPMRAFLLDVGRKPYSMDFLRALTKDLAYYKINVFHVHLNDDGASTFTGPEKSVCAFRLESETYPGLAAKDYHYTKAEFRAFVKEAAAQGVTVIPEIDSPAHTGCFRRYFRESGRKDEFSIVCNFTNTVAFIEKLFDEYLSGSDPVFSGPYVHIGMDEFGDKYSDEFRAYGKELRRIVRKHGKKVILWGANEHPEKPDGETICDTWSATGDGKGYDAVKMMANGYDVVCVQGGMLYIVPSAGYYNDYLNVKYLFEHWEPHYFGGKAYVKANDPHLLGGKFALWNDLSENGTSEDDSFDRIFPAIGAVAEKTWAGVHTNLDWKAYSRIFAATGEAPGVNIADRLTGPNGTPAKTDRAVGWSQGGGYAVSFDIMPSAGRTADATLFDDGFSRVTLTPDGRLGFMRDGLGHTFAAKLPDGRWTRVTFAGDPDGVNLSVDGAFAESTKGLSLFCPNWCNRNYSLYFRSPRTLHFPLVQKPFAGKIRNMTVKTGREPTIMRINADDYRTGDGFADMDKMAAAVNARGVDAVFIENARCDGPVEGGTRQGMIKTGEADVLAFRCCLWSTYGTKRMAKHTKAPDGTKRETALFVRDYHQDDRFDVDFMALPPVGSDGK